MLVVSTAVGKEFLHGVPPQLLKMTITASHEKEKIQKTLKMLSDVAADLLFSDCKQHRFCKNITITEVNKLIL